MFYHYQEKSPKVPSKFYHFLSKRPTHRPGFNENFHILSENHTDYYETRPVVQGPCNTSVSTEIATIKVRITKKLFILNIRKETRISSTKVISWFLIK